MNPIENVFIKGQIIHSRKKIQMISKSSSLQVLK